MSTLLPQTAACRLNKNEMSSHLFFPLLLAAALLFFVRVSPLAAGFFGASWSRTGWLGPAARSARTAAALFVRLHEFGDEIWTVEIFLWLPCVVFTRNDKSASTNINLQISDKQYRHANTVSIGNESGDDLLCKTFPLKIVLHSSLYNPPVQDLLHHVFLFVRGRRLVIFTVLTFLSHDCFKLLVFHPQVTERLSEEGKGSLCNKKALCI